MKIKNLFRSCLLMATALCMAATLPSCSDDDDEVAGPKFHKVEGLIGVEANADCRDAFKLKTVLTQPDGEQVSMGTEFALGSMKTFAAFELPATFTLEMTAEPKAGFTPEEGKDYNFNVKYSYEVSVVDDRDMVPTSVSESGPVIPSGSYETDPESIKGLLQLYFPFKLVITVKATGNSQDPYSINVEKVRIGK